MTPGSVLATTVMTLSCSPALSWVSKDTSTVPVSPGASGLRGHVLGTVQPQEVEEVSLDEWGIRRAREEHLAQEGGQRAGEQHQLELRQLLEHGKVDFERIRGPWERGREYQLGSKLEGMDLRSGREPAGRRSFRIHVAGLPRVCEPLESPSEHPRNALTSTTEPHRQGTPGTP